MTNKLRAKRAGNRRLANARFEDEKVCGSAMPHDGGRPCYFRATKKVADTR